MADAELKLMFIGNIVRMWGTKLISSVEAMTAIVDVLDEADDISLEKWETEMRADWKKRHSENKVIGK